MDLVVTAFGARPDTLTDTVPAVRAALESGTGRRGVRLVFPRGRYHFYRDAAVERLLWVSNNDGGVKRIGIPLFSVADFELEGNGSEFVFHGPMVPLAVWHAQGVRLRHFRVDWDRPFTLEGRILDQGPESLDLAMSPATPYVIRAGRISGVEDDCYPRDRIGVIEFDHERREYAWDTHYPGLPNRAEELEPGRVRLHGAFAPVRVGRLLLLRMEGRHSPAISVGRSAEIELEDVTLHAAAGMGLIAQESRDLRVYGLKVTPTPGSGRCLSVQDDATHFCNCRGEIVLENCRLEDNWDDGSNVHGIYRVVTQRGPNWVVTQVRHFQQLGVGMGEQDGDRFEFVDPATMQTIHEGEGYDYKVYSPQDMAITFREPLPENVRVGTCLANLSATPNLTVRNCYIRNTRPRGVLVNTPGQVRIEGNYFHTPGAGVLIGADCNFWYESGAVRDVLIRGNTFDNCRFMRETCTPAPVSIVPAVPEAGRGRPFERNIRIEENTFRAFDPLLVVARSVDGLIFRGNTIVRTTDYPAYSGKTGPLDVEDCLNVTVADNTHPCEPDAGPPGR